MAVLPLTDLEGVVTLVNRFALRTSPEEFEKAFETTAEFLTRQSGFLGYTLLRHTEAGAEPQYVNIAWWQDLACLRRAVEHPDFPAHAAAVRELSTSEPNTYVVRAKVMS